LSISPQAGDCLLLDSLSAADGIRLEILDLDENLIAETDETGRLDLKQANGDG
jgi:hypothetical protein